MTPEREYRSALVGLALGAVLVLATSAFEWGTAVTNEAAAGQAAGTVRVTGTALAPALSPLALVALAGIVGVLATAGVARRIVGGFVFLAGLGLLASVLGARFGTAAATSAVRSVTGVASSAAVSVSWNLAWVASLVGALLICSTAALVVVRSSRWATLSSRYERDAAAGAPRSTMKSDAWSQLDRGEDPTADPNHPLPSIPAPDTMTTEPTTESTTPIEGTP